MSAVTLPHVRRLRGAPLGFIWLGLVVGGWVAAYLFARLVIAVGHALGDWLP